VVLNSETLQLAFWGSAGLDGRLDAKAAVRAQTMVDEAIEQVPLVRGILHGKDKSLLPVWLKLEGTVEDPKVKVSALKSISAPVLDTAGRIFRLPKEALDRLKGKP
jgi:hypothetical protein